MWYRNSFAPVRHERQQLLGKKALPEVAIYPRVPLRCCFQLPVRMQRVCLRAGISCRLAQTSHRIGISACGNWSVKLCNLPLRSVKRSWKHSRCIAHDTPVWYGMVQRAAVHVSFITSKGLCGAGSMSWNCCYHTIARWCTIGMSK